MGLTEKTGRLTDRQRPTTALVTPRLTTQLADWVSDWIILFAFYIRTLTFLTVRHLFTKFTSDGLYTCLFTESEPETVRLYLAINKYSLEKWAKHELKDPPPKDLNEREAFEQRFSVDSGNQVIYVCDCWNVRDNLRDISDSHTFENSWLWRLIMFLIMLD